MKTQKKTFRKWLTAKYLVVFVAGLAVSIFAAYAATTTINTNLSQAVQYIQSIVLTSDGGQSGTTGVVIDGVDGTITSNGFISKGIGVTANGLHSIALGNGTAADGTAAIALGYRTNANGTNSIAMGNTTQANGTDSTAMGNHTQALGDMSTAMGYGTIASGDVSTVMGAYNVGLSNAIFELGIGTSGARANALTVLANNGYVGIGTAAPQFNFDINGTTRINSNIMATQYCNYTGDVCKTVESLLTGYAEIDPICSTFTTGNRNTAYNRVQANSGVWMVSGTDIAHDTGIVYVNSLTASFGHIIAQYGDVVATNGVVEASGFVVQGSGGINYHVQFTGSNDVLECLDFKGGLLVATGNCI